MTSESESLLAEQGYGPIKDRTKLSLLPQIIVAIACASVHLGIGCIFSFSGVTLPQLTEHHSLDVDYDYCNETFNTDNSGECFNNETQNDIIPAVLTPGEASFFSSAAFLGATAGATMSGPLMVLLGQRTALLIGLPITLTTWIMVAGSVHSSVLLVARVLQGLGMGLISLPGTMLVVESSHANFRGPLCATVDLARNFGVLVMFGVGATKLLWRYQALICGLITTVPAFIILLFLSHSPRWLASRGRIPEAAKALTFYRGAHYDTLEELQQIEIIAAQGGDGGGGIKHQFIYMMQPHILRLVGICVGVAVGTQFTGNYAIMAYAVPILTEAVKDMDPYVGAVLLGLLRTVGGILFLTTSRVMDRTITYLSTMLLCCVSLVVLATHMYFENLGVAPEWTWWIPMAALLLFICMITIATAVAGLQVAELLPLNCRSLAYGITDVSFYTTAFTISNTFPYLREVLTPSGVFWFYGICTFFIAWIPYGCLPETRGKHLEEIENNFLRHEHKKRVRYGSLSL